VPDADGSGNVVVTYPDGQQARFGANLTTGGQPTGGRLIPPPGRYATLVPRPAAEGGGWTLTDKSARLYVFRPDGRPAEIYDNAGRSVAFTPPPPPPAPHAPSATKATTPTPTPATST
jgi:hypothetical protein